MDVPTASKTMTNSSSSNTTPASSSSSSGEAARTGSPGGENKPRKMGNNMKADAEHPEDPEREHGKWMRTEANKRNSVKEDGGIMVTKTMQYLKTLDKAETRKESEGLVEIEELAQAEVN